MRKKFFSMAIFCLTIHALAIDTIIIKLPDPELEKGKPLMQVLQERQTRREFSERDLSFQELSNLLWAANGINRKESGKRTAPTSRNKQEIEVYVCTQKGVFWYNAIQHALVTIHNRDIRALTGMQPFVATAPVNLVIVADYNKMGSDLQANKETACIDAGFVCQNIYLYGASENLAVVVRGLVDREKLALEMNLENNLHIVIAQSVGYPK